MNRKLRWQPLLVSIIIAEIVGAISSFLSGDIKTVYGALKKPPLAPPAWLFSVVWILLFALMGAAAYLIWQSGCKQQTGALRIYGLSLFVVFFWPVFFFRFGMRLFAFAWLLLLIWLVFKTMLRFYRCTPAAGKLLLPFWLWLWYAGYLNFSFWLLNRG